MTRACSARALSLLLLVVLAATASRAAEPGSRKGAASATPQTLAQRLCDALHALPAARRAECCGTSASSGLAEACARTLGDALRARAVTLDAAGAERCVAASAQELEGCAWVGPRSPRVPESCRGIVHGLRRAGARCRSSLECADGSFCWGGGAGQEGFCAPPGAPRTSCSGFVDALASALRQTDGDRHPECAGTCVRGRCASFVARGGTCSTSAQCGPDAHCASDRCVAGPRPDLGEECAGTTCRDGLACLEGRCAPPKKAGESCTKPFECEGACLPAAPGKSRLCGTQCSALKPAGHAPAAAASR